MASCRQIPARVILGDSLTLETIEVSYTAWMRNLPAPRQNVQDMQPLLVAAE